MSDSLKADFSETFSIKLMSCFQAKFCKKKDYKRMLVKSQKALLRELDLKKFIHRQRLTLAACLGLL